MSEKTYNLCFSAIEAEGQSNVNEKWKAVYGRPFPSAQKKSIASNVVPLWRNTEEFIEDKFQVDIRYQLKMGLY